MYYENVFSNLQRALIPPSIPMMDTEEPWRSSMTIAGQASWEVVVRSIKGNLKCWKAGLSVQVGWLSGQDISSWGNCEVLEIDHSIFICNKLVDTISRESRQSYNRAMKLNRRLTASSRKMAATQKRHADLVRGWRSEIVSVLNEMGSLLTLYRNRLPANVTFATLCDTRLLPL